MNPLELGVWGELAAARYLRARGLRVIDRHYQRKWGEIDLICRDSDTWVFVEVKTRSRQSEPRAIDAVHRSKRQRFFRAASSYLREHRLDHQPVRFDIVTLEGNEIEWIQDAFGDPR